MSLLANLVCIQEDFALVLSATYNKYIYTIYVMYNLQRIQGQQDNITRSTYNNT